jgi:Sigma-70, region 4
VRSRADPRADFDEFVAVCSGRLLRTSYLLTGDLRRAEDLLQRALARARVAWHRLDRQPELYVRRLLVEAAAPWWKSRARSQRRAVLVLRYFDDLSEEDTAELLGVPVTVAQHLEADAGGPHGALAEELRALLRGLTDDAQRGGMPERLSGVDSTVATLRRRRRAFSGAATSFVLAGAAVALVLAPRADSGADPPLIPAPEPVKVVAPAPPSLAGYQLSPLLSVDGVDYQYLYSRESVRGRPRLRVLLAASRLPEAVAWVSPPNLGGRIVVTVDGDVVRTDEAGSFQSGLLLSSRRPHVIVLRATKPEASMRLGVAVYRWPPT